MIYHIVCFYCKRVLSCDNEIPDNSAACIEELDQETCNFQHEYAGITFYSTATAFHQDCLVFRMEAVAKMMEEKHCEGCDCPGLQQSKPTPEQIEQNEKYDAAAKIFKKNNPRLPSILGDYWCTDLRQKETE